MRYHSGIERACGLCGGSDRKEGERFCKLYVGTTGSGKTHRAFEEMPNAYVWDGGKWWDNYDGQEEVIVDDFCDENDRKRMAPLNDLLKFIDHYKCQVQVKGGYRWLKAKRFIFTSNIPLSEWYPMACETRQAALRRRFTRTINFIAEYAGNPELSALAIEEVERNADFLL